MTVSTRCTPILFVLLASCSILFGDDESREVADCEGNLADNPGFESEILSWNSNDRTSISHQTEVVRTGQGAGRIESGGDSNGNIALGIDVPSPGKYEFSAFFNCESPTEFRIELVESGAFERTEISLSCDDWQGFKVEKMLTSSAQAKIYSWAADSVNFVDDICIRAAP